MLLEHFKIVELTQPLYEGAPTWNGSCGYRLEIQKDYDQLFRVHQLQMDAGIGTHMDAPCHLVREGASIEKIYLDKLIVQACIIDVSSQEDANYEISVEDIEKYEKAYGLIPKGSLVIGYTGWSRFWLDATAYRNMDSLGQMHFPAFSAKAAEALLARDIAGIAIDSLSPDCMDNTFPVHKLILEAGKYIIENIGDCSQIPPKGAYVIALPLRIEGSSESPIRIVGLIPNMD